jgi:hypothetical protein
MWIIYTKNNDTMKLRHEIDYEGLERFLRTLKREDIETCWRKPDNPKLITGKSVNSIEFFKIENTPPERVIAHGEPFLVDALGNDLSIVILSRKKYKLPTGRVIKAKFVKTIIKDCHEAYGTALNGYWKIPSQFIKQI